jgi:hypothetical protein
MREIRAKAIEEHLSGTSASSLHLECERPAFRYW